MKNSLDKYVPYVGEGEVNEIISLAKQLGPIKIQHINSTRTGGGVAEILNCIIPRGKKTWIFRCYRTKRKVRMAISF